MYKMKLIIAGSRDIELSVEELDELIIKHFKNDKIEELVSGYAKGMDMAGVKWAIKNNIPIKKFLPDWVFKLSTRQVRILIHAMILGDGTYIEKRRFYYTTSTKLADQFSQLCLHAGWSSTISVHLKAGNKNIIKGRDVISNYDVLK